LRGRWRSRFTWMEYWSEFHCFQCKTKGKVRIKIFNLKCWNIFQKSGIEEGPWKEIRTQKKQSAKRPEKIFRAIWIIRYWNQLIKAHPSILHGSIRPIYLGRFIRSSYWNQYSISIGPWSRSSLYRQIIFWNAEFSFQFVDSVCVPLGNSSILVRCFWIIGFEFNYTPIEGQIF